MNHIYRHVWNELTRAWVAVAENAKGRGKRGSAMVGTLAASFALIGAPAHAIDASALPSGGQVVAGSASISQTINVLTVQQASQRAALDWQSFNIGAAATVNFVQPGSSAVALNRIVGNEASQIYGKINANGQVFFSNPNGMLFARGAEVNVGGILATTLSLGNDDFMAGNYRFGNPGSGSIRNEGIINALGSVVLIGNDVHNTGQIIATTVTLAAGNTVAIDLTGDGLIRARVEDAALTASIENSGSIDAITAVTMTAGQAQNTLDRVVNNSGVIRATGLIERGGEILLEAAVVENTGSIVASGKQGGGSIKLMGEMANGTVKVGGTLDASSANGNGGFIETSAAHVKIANDARVTTAASVGMAGTWLIDPVDFTIAASGGDITGATLTTNLGSGNVSILSTSGTAGTAGNVNVNDVVSWSANKLTLNAQNNININANLNGSSSASLAFEYGQGAAAAGNTSTYNVNAPVNLPAGNNFSTKLGSDGTVKSYTVITTLGAAASTSGTDLQGINANLAGNYVLGSDVDASTTSGWNAGSGFLPLGNPTTKFTGTFDGLGHAIAGLLINRPSTSYIGLIGFSTSSTSIRNVALVGGSVIGADFVGGLVGYNMGGSISNSYTTGTVNGSSGSGGGVGGLAGNNSGTIINSHATGGVTSTFTNVGGLVGYNSGGVVSYSYATGAVNSSSTNVGGLIGNSSGSTASVSNSFATGTVTSTAHNIGGLVGANSGVVTYSFAAGSVSGTQNVGGLIGSSTSSSAASVANSFATGSVTGTLYYIGGLVGIMSNGGVVDSYATGNVTSSYTGNAYSGGLIGYLSSGAVSSSYSTGNVTANNGKGLIGLSASSTVTNSYWDITTSGQATSSGGTGLTTAQMQAQSSFSGWDFTNTWKIIEGASYPYLAGFANRWTTATSGDWTTASKWSLGHIPIAGENVVIDNLGSAYTVTISSGSQYVATLTSQNPLSITGGSLAVSGVTSGGGTLSVSGGTLTLNGASSIAALNLNSGTLNGTGSLSVSNSFGYTSGSIGSGFSSIALNQISGNLNVPALTAANAITLSTVAGDVVLNGAQSTTAAGSNIVVNSAAGFTNSAGVGALSAGSGGRWLVYAANPSSVTKNGLTSNFRHYGASYGSYASPTETGNGFIYASAAGTLAVDTALASGSASSVYGDTPTAVWTYTLSGTFADSEDNASNIGLSGTPVFTAPTSTTNAGSLTVSNSGVLTSTSGYGFTTGSGYAYIIIPAPLTVTAANANRYYGDANPTFTGSITGFKNSETASVLSAQPTYSTPATLTSNVGSYQIVGAGGTATNYTFSYVDGSLTIDPATLTLTADNQTRLYGDANPTLTGSITGFKNSETASVLTAWPTYSTPAKTTSNVGSYQIVGAGGTAQNYSFSYIDGNLTITPATLNYVATPASRAYGADNPTFTGTVAGFMLSDTLATVTTGTAAFSSTATATSPGGQYAIDGSGLTLVTSNYLLAQAAANASALTIVSEPPSPSPATTSVASASVVTDTATAIQTATSSTNLIPLSATSSTESDGATTLATPILQIVTVGSATVQKPAEQVMQVERPKGRMLVCRG